MSRDPFRAGKARARVRRFTWSRPALSLLGLLIAYYAFPVKTDQSPGALALSLVLTAVGVGLLTWMMIKELNHVRHGQDLLGPQTLAMLLVLLVMSASMAFFLIDLVDESQIVGFAHQNRCALFHARHDGNRRLSAMSTRQGQLARAIVSCLIVFNVVVIAGLVRANTTRPRN